MKTILKIATLATAVAMALALTACGGSSSSSAASSASSSSASASSSSTASSASSASASASAASSSSESAAADKYTNDYFGIAYFLPNGWSFADTADLKKVNSQAAAVATGSAIGMVATSADGQTSVIAAVEEANSANSGQTAEAHLDAEVKQMTESATASSVSYNSESSTVTFEGATTALPAAMTKLTQDGKTIYICQAVMEKNGDFFDIIVQGPTEEAVSEALSNFHLILS